MKNKLKLKSIIFEIIILVICFIAACLGMYFYFRQFEPWKAKETSDNSSNYVINNYISYPIENRKFTQTISSIGTLNISNDSIKQIELKDVYIKSGIYFEKNTKLGKTALDEEVSSTSFGCVINIELDNNGIYTLTYVDYALVDIIFTFENSYEKYIEYDKEYLCAIGGFDAYISLSLMEVDYTNGGFCGLFNMVKIKSQKEHFIYDNEDCTLILDTKEYEMYSIDKDLVESLEIKENETIQLTLVDNEGNYSQGKLTFNCFGDYYVGVSSDITLKNKSICIEKDD